MKSIIRKNDKSMRGFTLIELLIVVGVIIILSTMALISVDRARLRAREAKIASDLNQIRSVGELIYSISRNYTDMNSNNDINRILNDMTSEGATNVSLYSSSIGYCVKVNIGWANKWGCVNNGLAITVNLTNDPSSISDGCDGTVNGRSPRNGGYSVKCQ